MGAIRGVAEVVLNVRNMEMMVRFYTEVVGLTPHSRYPFEHPTIVFLEIAPLDSALGRTHPQLLALVDPVRHRSAAGKFDAIEQRRSALNHLAFEIDEEAYPSELARLEGLGLAPMGVRFEHMRARAIFFQDPEGNRLELICHDRDVSEEEARLAGERLDRELRSNG
jgi:catechol 2,3-dioxygenase-like lactoylglutathione lyase family enzyme